MPDFVEAAKPLGVDMQQLARRFSLITLDVFPWAPDR
jgi:hypothetical protein